MPIRPEFAALPNQAMAAAISEPFMQVGEYKFIHDQLYGEPDFPPVPTTIMTILAAYLEDDRFGIPVRRKMAVLTDKIPDPRQASELYERRVGMLQQAEPRLKQLEYVAARLQGDVSIDLATVRTTYHSGRRLLAAHIIGRTLQDGVLIDALCYPALVKQQVPLLARDALVRLLPTIDELGPNRLEGVGSGKEVHDGLKALMQNDESISLLGAVAVCGFLPTPEQFRSSLEQYG